MIRYSQPEPEPPPPERRPVDILMVDDNPAKLLALESALTPLGENLVRAGSGREALRHLLERDFATIVLDVNMPDVDGFETAQMIRARPRSASTPIIFTSAVNIDEADVRRGYALGAVDYICAPIVPELLRVKVSVFVELHRRTEEARIQAAHLRERTLELERSQKDLRLSERMASIGTLCAGLGHDMGNLLLPVSVWIDTLDPAELPREMREGVESLQTCVHYLRKLASGLRLVSLDPTQEYDSARVALARWVDDVGPVLRNALPRGITLEIDVPGSLPEVRIAPHRLAQAVFNLVQNAGEALRGRDGGVVRLWAAPDKSGGVRIGVTDNGPGMPPQVLVQCLDPFFTTKTRGISTGLGLSLVHGIVRSAGSELVITSDRGQGATFCFVLPPAPDRSQVMAEARIDVADARTRALAAAVVSAGGCRVVTDPPADAHAPAIWILDARADADDLAREFKSAGTQRAVFVIDPTLAERLEARPVTLTGAKGLAVEVRRFVAGLSTLQPAAAPD